MARHETLDERFLAIGQEVPGFAGVFIDSAGIPTALLVDPTQEVAARMAIQPLLLNPARAYRGRMVQRDQMNVRRVEYDFKQLMGWRMILRSLLVTVPGVHRLDIRESMNRIVLGVRSPSDSTKVSSEITRLGIPPNAVITLVEAPEQDAVLDAVSLDGNFDQKKGGIQIEREGYGNCTLGFNVRFTAGSVYYPGFVTNSHCTRTFGGAEATRFFQPSIGTYTKIGVEISDPPFLQATAGCPLGARCRYSDAALVSYDTGIPWAGASIARTNYYDPTYGSLVIDFENPQFTVTDDYYILEGYRIDKIGATSGWTYGLLEESCFDTLTTGGSSDYMLLCQYRSSNGMAPGDSGSPVFYWNGGSQVTLIGLARGFTNSRMTFSNFYDIKDELGFYPWQISGF